MSLELIGIHKSFGQHKALNDIHLNLKPGRITLLLGPNGAGKTTLNCILAGALYPDTGSLSFYGRSIGDKLPYRVGFVPDSDCLDPEISVQEFLQLMAGIKEARPDEIQIWIEKLDLQDVQKQRIGQLSLGFRQRVALAQALLANPEVLLLDEPGNGLDPIQFHHLIALLCSVKENRIVLVSTHRIRDAELFGDDLILLQGGQVLKTGSSKDLTSYTEGYFCRIRGDFAYLEAFLHTLEIPVQRPHAEEICFFISPENWTELAPKIKLGATLALEIYKHRPLEELFRQNFRP